MSRKIFRAVKRFRDASFRKMSHGDLITKLLAKETKPLDSRPVIFVETGCGISTLSLAKTGQNIGGTVYSCDYNSEKADELKSASPELLNNVKFMIGDSHESLEKIAAEHDNVRFLFLDSAASAMHTFREFMIIEKHLHAGSQVLVDNAAVPGEKRLLSPVRKGKILVPYLLASPFWEVSCHPDAGDSMVSAVMHEEADYADPDYEDSAYIDNWRMFFNNKLP